MKTERMTVAAKLRLHKKLQVPARRRETGNQLAACDEIRQSSDIQHLLRCDEIWQSGDIQHLLDCDKIRQSSDVQHLPHFATNLSFLLEPRTPPLSLILSLDHSGSLSSCLWL